MELRDIPELQHILFVTIPEDSQQLGKEAGIDPERLLPVETQTPDASQWNPSDLSWEMIIAAMLKILAYKPDYSDADYYRRVIMQIRPDVVAELSETGILKARNGDFTIAEEIFRALSGLVPDSQQAQVNLALLYEQMEGQSAAQGDETAAQAFAENAFETYKALLQRDDPIPDVHLNAGFFFLQHKNYDRAYSELSEYVERGDDEEKKQEALRIIKDIETRNLQDQLFKEAYDFIQLGKEREGIDRITRFLEKNPTVWNGWFMLGWAHRRLGEYPEASNAFERCLAEGGENADTLNELAICHMELGKLDDAKHKLERAITLEPENTKVMSNLGIVALKRERPEEAKAFFLSVLEFDENDPIATRYLEILNEA